MSYPPSFYGYTPEFDTYSASQVTISHAHSEIHEGDAYTISMVVALTAGTTFNCIFTTPANPKRVHFFFDCRTAGNGITTTFYEGASITGGTPATAINRNRNVTTTAGLTIAHSPTVSGNGTQIFTTYLDATKQSGGSSAHSTDEFILKPSTVYLMSLVVDAGQNATFSGRAEWYEADTLRGGA